MPLFSSAIQETGNPSEPEENAKKLGVILMDAPSLHAAELSIEKALNDFCGRSAPGVVRLYALEQYAGESNDQAPWREGDVQAWFNRKR